MQQHPELVPDEPALRVQAASKWRAVGDNSGAIPHLEWLADYFEKEENWEELVKILRWILEADSTRHDVSFRLNQLTTKLTREKKRRRKRLVAGACILATAAVLTGIPVLYQFRAKVAYASLQKKNADLVENHEYDKAETLLSSYIKKYSWSSWKDEAQKALEKVRALKSEYRQRVERERTRKEEQLKLLQERPARLLAAAREMEERGNLEQTHHILHELLTRFPGSPEAKKATFPLILSSLPPGAEVRTFDGNRLLGTTPLKIRYRQGQDLALVLSYPGCEETVWRLGDKTKWNARVELKWAPVAEFSHPCPVDREVYAFDDSILFSSRDGSLYLIDPFQRRICWRRRIGCYGDPSSALLVKGGKIYVGNLEGEFLCLNGRSGKTIWRCRLPGPARGTPVVRGRDTVYTATADGYVVKMVKGEIEVSIKLDGEIATGIFPAKKAILVGTSCDFCYALAPRNLSPRWRETFDYDVIQGPIPLGSVAAVVTKDNTLRGIDTQKGSAIWKIDLPASPSAPPSIAGRILYLPLENGELWAVDPSGRTLWTRKIHGAPIGGILSVGNKLFFGDQAGRFHIFDTSRRTVAWTYDGPAPVTAKPCILNGKLLFATTKGNFFFMEIMP